MWRSWFVCVAVSALTVIPVDRHLLGQQASSSPASKIVCDPDNGGLTLPDGFCASVIADNLGTARHLSVAPNGDIFVAFEKFDGARGSAVGLRDTNGDGKADQQEWFGNHFGTGIAVRQNFLVASSDTAVYRYPLKTGQLKPEGQPETLISDFLVQETHASKNFTFDDANHIYVNVGAPSNECQAQDRKQGVPGQSPCPQLERQAGVWRFAADRVGQTQVKDGHRFSTGIRNAVALSWDPTSRAVYAVQHGRDQLNTMFPALFTAEQNAEAPAEEFLRLTDGADFGWPMCYFDPLQKRRLLAPEYGGDGKTPAACAKLKDPLVAFPGHYAPNALMFYTGSQFPERYRSGAFVAFHGSWNRGPLEQRGYQVAFVPMSKGEVTGTWEVFADGFAGEQPLKSPRNAKARPVGLAQGPDGSLYISDSVKGRIWRIVAKTAARPSNGQ